MDNVLIFTHFPFFLRTSTMAEADPDPDWSDDEGYLEVDLDFEAHIEQLRRRNIDNGELEEGDDDDGQDQGYEIDEGVFAEACTGAAKTVEENTKRSWFKMHTNVRRPPDRLFPYDDTQTGIAPEIGVTLKTSIANMFRLFFSMEFLTRIVNATNDYARSEREANPERHRSAWMPLDVPSLTKFISLTFLMGIVRKARIKDYWNQAPEIVTPYFPQVMTRDRFTSILR